MKKLMMTGMLVALVGLTGCARKTNIETYPINGSKSDGVVMMGYTYRVDQIPVLNESNMSQKAEKKCKTWGYTGAEMFGGQESRCNQMGGWGCIQTSVTITYQCTGGKASQN